MVNHYVEKLGLIPVSNGPSEAELTLATSLLPPFSVLLDQSSENRAD